MNKQRPYTCARCGQTWPRDPALEVPCPQCQAPAGVNCRRPSGHPLPGMGGERIHFARDQGALDAGLLQKCPGEKARKKAPLEAPDASR
jgi:DNA-directed RNA polymerase subunit RPC12/RpoP